MSKLYGLLAKAVERTAGNVAIVEEETRWTFAELDEKVNRLASTLSKKGVQPGDRIAIMFSNQKEFLVSFFAVLRLAAVVVPVNIQLPPQDILYVLQNSGSRLLMTTAAFAGHFAGSPMPLLVSNQTEPALPSWEDAVAGGDPSFKPSATREPNALGILMYTSGTTGKPKGVMLTEENLVANLEGIDPVFHFNAEDKVLLALPLFHAFGLIIGLYSLNLSAALVLVPKFAPKAILHAIATEHATVLPLVPTMFNLLLAGVERMGAEPLKSLRFCISGGASLPPELLKRIEASLDLQVLEGYGLTETSPVISVNRPERGSIPGSVGKPLDNVRVQLFDDAGNPISWNPGEESAVGEICVQGPNLMLGYYGLPEETAQVMDALGWFHTGDLGHFDAEGNLFISGGRKKDLIIKAGENIAPVRVEQVLYQHPAVHEASVIGVKDPKVGEEILACIQLKPEQTVTEAELKKFCRQHLPPFMVPEAFRFYDELPKNPTGKIQKNLLREENQSLTTSAS